MTYTSGGLIQASDYNDFLGGSTSNVSGSINSIWSTGYGNAGYGQTSNLANVAISDTVTAQQWNALTYVIDKVSNHQNNANSNVSLVNVGANIVAQSNLTSTLSNLYSNRLIAFDTGNVANYNQTVTLRANGNQSFTGNVSYAVQFASADQARYFFNAGGRLNLQYYSFSNELSNDRGTSIQTLVQTNFSNKDMRSNSFGARGGSGGTLITDITTGTAGYYGITSSPATKFRVDSSLLVYTGDYFLVDFYNTGSSGSNGGNGDAVQINAVIFSSTTGSTDPIDRLDVNVTMRLTVIEPALDYLSNSWGPITVTSSSSSTPAPIPPLPGSQSYSTPGTYSFTVPSGVTSLTCTVVGAGGGGGGFWNAGDAWSGAGGGSGGFYSNSVITVTPGEVISVTVGAGGIGGSGLSTGTWVCLTSVGTTFNGTAGGSSSIGSYLVATGGAGAGNPVAGGPVGTGGSPNGVQGSYAALNCLGNLPGGNNGTGYGSGGMGGSCVNPFSGACGQDGSNGYVLILWG